MNDLQKVIYEYNEIKARVLELENRLSELNVSTEPVKWQPSGGDWFINQCDGAVEYWKMSTEATKVAGLERQTKEQAEHAAVEMRRFNRLLAIRDELCGDELVVNWGDDYSEKYNVYFSHERGCWYVSSDIFCESIQPYFTSEELAQKACDMLNSGEVEL